MLAADSTVFCTMQGTKWHFHWEKCSRVENVSMCEERATASFFAKCGVDYPNPTAHYFAPLMTIDQFLLIDPSGWGKFCLVEDGGAFCAEDEAADKEQKDTFSSKYFSQQKALNRRIFSIKSTNCIIMSSIKSGKRGKCGWSRVKISRFSHRNRFLSVAAPKTHLAVALFHVLWYFLIFWIIVGTFGLFHFVPTVTNNTWNCLPHQHYPNLLHFHGFSHQHDILFHSTMCTTLHRPIESHNTSID